VKAKNAPIENNQQDTGKEGKDNDAAGEHQPASAKREPVRQKLVARQ
jgi:hypothetical protein